MTWVDRFANINVYVVLLPNDLCCFGLICIRFFKYPFYDKKTIEYAEDNKQPFSLMEVISLSITDLHAPKYTKPVMVYAWLLPCREFIADVFRRSSLESMI